MLMHDLSDFVDNGANPSRVAQQAALQRARCTIQIDAQRSQAGGGAREGRHHFIVVWHPRCQWCPFDQAGDIATLRDVGLARAKRQQASVDSRQPKCHLDKRAVAGTVGDSWRDLVRRAVGREHRLDGASHATSEGQLTCRRKRLKTLLGPAEVDRRAMT